MGTRQVCLRIGRHEGDCRAQVARGPGRVIAADALRGGAAEEDLRGKEVRVRAGGRIHDRVRTVDDLELLLTPLGALSPLVLAVTDEHGARRQGVVRARHVEVEARRTRASPRSLLEQRRGRRRSCRSARVRRRSEDSSQSLRCSPCRRGILQLVYPRLGTSLRKANDGAGVLIRAGLHIALGCARPRDAPPAHFKKQARTPIYEGQCQVPRSPINQRRVTGGDFSPASRQWAWLQSAWPGPTGKANRSR